MTTGSPDGSASRHPICVLVVDGFRIFADLLTEALDREHDLQCVGAVGDTTTAVLEAVRLQPDVVLVVGPHLEVEDWSTAVVALAAACPAGRLVLLVPTASREAHEHLTRARDSVVHADAAEPAALLAAVRDDPHGVDAASAPASRGDGTDPHNVVVTPLTPADLTLLRLVAAGYDSESAARELRISPGFVRHRLRRICTDLGADTPAQAVAIAVASRVLTLHPEG